MDSARLKQIVLGFSKAVVGLAIAGEGLRTFSGRPAAQLGAAPANPARLLAPAQSIRSVKKLPVRSIDERIDYIRKMIQRTSLEPSIREAAARILNQKCGDRWCIAEKDYKAEVEALFWAIRKVSSPYAVRYMRDHVKVDQFANGRNTLAMRGGDCDDMSILLGALLQVAGFPVRMRIVQARGEATWSHIYLLAGIPPTAPTRWVALDLTVDQPPGWEVAGAEDAKLSGRPAGDVVKTKDYEV